MTDQSEIQSSKIYYRKDEESMKELPHFPTTVYDVFIKALKEAPNASFLGERTKDGDEYLNYSFQTYQQIYQRVLNFSSGLMNMINNHQLYINKAIKSIGVYSNNRIEWTISDLSFTFQNLTCVGVYNTYSKEQLEYIFRHSEVEVLITNQVNLVKLLSLKVELFGVKLLINMDFTDPNLKLWMEQTYGSGIMLMDFKEVEELGKIKKLPLNPSKEDSVYTICYTSGSTGNPKGVVNTHHNYTCNLITSYREFSKLKLKSKVYFSYLPLAHCFERSTFITMMHYKVAIGFYSGNIKNFLTDIRQLKPSILNCVPAILTKIYDQVQFNLNQNTYSAQLFNKFVQYKLANYYNGLGVTSVYDNLFLTKIKDAIGGNVKILGVGSAPIDKRALDVLKVCLAVNIKQGYGSTETSSLISVTDLEDKNSGHVGFPGLQIQVKLIDVPSMNYYVKDKPYPRGEILVKGPNVFKEYYKNAVATKEAFDNENWFYTGDIGYFDDENRLFIIDRKSSIFKLANGEFISPERIENILNQHELIEQSVIYGKKERRNVVVLIKPDIEKFELKFKNQDEYQIKQAFLNSIKEHGLKLGLNNYEIPNNIMLITTPFTIEGGELTDSFKLKRSNVYKKYEKELDSLYV
ncbi:acetyl-CoA synthetase-like protein [Neoconidiobolus thromboides FSU 785]|nr:acetyl-CoA synthetase-like protein [Neoconidiobolus thromboides FSU 785]